MSRRSEACPTCGLPVELAALLRDQGVVVSQDGAVFDLIASYRNAPSNTAAGPQNSAANGPERKDFSDAD